LIIETEFYDDHHEKYYILLNKIIKNPYTRDNITDNILYFFLDLNDKIIYKIIFYNIISSYSEHIIYILEILLSNHYININDYIEIDQYINQFITFKIINIEDKITPINYPYLSYDINVVNLLLKYGADVNIQDKNGQLYLFNNSSTIKITEYEKGGKKYLIPLNLLVAKK
jgi:hypothetical protein